MPSLARSRKGQGGRAREREEAELWQNTLQKMHPIYENGRVM